MTTPPRTISDLGVDVSSEWAKNKAIEESFTLRGAPSGISLAAEIDVTIPAYPSEFEKLLGPINQFHPRAEFNAPEGYSSQKNRIFTPSQIVASISEERIEAQINRLKTLAETALKESAFPWEQARETSDFKNEQKILLEFEEKLKTLTRIQVDINGFRNQYKRG